MLKILAETVKEIFSSVNNIIAPHHCLLCEKYIGEISHRFEFICDNCADSLSPAPDPDELLNRLVEIFPQDDIALTHIISQFGVTDDPPFENILHALKYQGFSRIGLEFGRELGEFLKKFSPIEYDIILPVPIHHARERERGFNQSALLAKGISNVMKIPAETKNLVRRKYTQTQTKLTAEERKKNVADIFRVRLKEKIFGKNILLIDDVFTTGSTMNSAAMALLESGARRVDGATLSAALRR